MPIPQEIINKLPPQERIYWDKNLRPIGDVHHCILSHEDWKDACVADEIRKEKMEMVNSIESLLDFFDEFEIKSKK